jgi:hypothetical protein
VQLEDNEYHKNGTIYPTTTSLGTSHLQCDKCNDVAVMSYRLIEDVRNTDEEGNERNITEVLHYFPGPRIIHIPQSCPENIKSILANSFILYWVDLGSCANKIRSAVEAIMSHYNIDSTLTLHSRLVAFKASQPKVSQYLLAIKWIGNAGSHDALVSKEAILDAYELLEYSLEILFNDREKSLDELSAKINIERKHT